ncbi:MAG: hypothetical protein HYY24_13450 [Verrucomicrobia bacterium]|nr:hypothetical protein [Verrucomicrobiota bacterium]
MAVRVLERFSGRLKTVEGAREPFRTALQRELPVPDDVRLLVYTPAHLTSKAKPPASVLALTHAGWLVVAETEDGETATSRSDFAHTLLVELTVVLLYGSLRIDFVADGRAQSVTIEFNTVMERLYEEAAQLLLDGIDGVSRIAPVDRRTEWRMLSALPLKFCNAALEFTPQGQHLLALAHWPAVFAGRHRWSQRELAPEAMLALTERELMLISEEAKRSWWRGRRVNNYGSIITHCPFLRLDGFHVTERGPLARLDLALRADAVEETVQVPLPADQKAAAMQIVLRAFERKEAARQAAD